MLSVYNHGLPSQSAYRSPFTTNQKELSYNSIAYLFSSVGKAPADFPHNGEGTRPSPSPSLKQPKGLLGRVLSVFASSSEVRGADVTISPYGAEVDIKPCLSAVLRTVQSDAEVLSVLISELLLPSKDLSRFRRAAWKGTG